MVTAAAIVWRIRAQARIAQLVAPQGSVNQEPGTAGKAARATPRSSVWVAGLLESDIECVDGGIDGHRLVDYGCVSWYSALQHDFFALALSLHAASSTQKVENLSESIAQKEVKYIRLLSGSSWLLSSPSLALVTDDVIIVFQELELKNKERVSVAFVDGEKIPVNHVRGRYVTSVGYLTTVVQTLGRGAVLRLTNGSLLSLPNYDRYDTGWWLPPYPALLTADKMYLWNLKAGKRVWISPGK